MEPPPNPSGWKNGWLTRFQLSLAARVASTICVALVLLSFVTWRIYLTDPRRIPWWDYLHPLQWAMLGFLLLTIFTSVYWAVRLWKQDYAASDTSIEMAWQAGLRALSKSGRDLSRTPVCLLMGCKDSETAVRVVAGGGCRTTEAAVPSGEPPIQWILCEDQVFLHIQSPSLFSETTARLRLRPSSCEGPVLSAASKLLRRFANSRAGGRQDIAVRNAPASVPQMRRDDQVTEEAVHEGSAWVDIESNADDATADDSTSQALTYEVTSQNVTQSRIRSSDESVATVDRVAETVDGSRGSSSLRESLFRRLDSLQYALSKEERTLDQTARLPLSTNVEDCNSPGAFHAGKVFDAMGEERNIEFKRAHPVMTPSEERFCTQQLSDTMRRLRALRDPVLGINSLLVCLDAAQLTIHAEHAHEAGVALSKDLEVVEEVLGVKAATHFLVHGMEGLDGFTELTRRLGPNASLSHTLGETFPSQRVGNEASLQAWITRSIRSVVLAAYGGLISTPTAPANTHHQLFQLVIRMRGNVSQSLESFLRGLMSTTKDSVPMFSTFAFASCGSESKEQAFLVPLFSAMAHEQDAAGWTSRAMVRELRYSRLVAIAQISCAFLIILLIVQTFIALRD